MRSILLVFVLSLAFVGSAHAQQQNSSKLPVWPAVVGMSVGGAAFAAGLVEHQTFNRELGERRLQLVELQGILDRRNNLYRAAFGAATLSVSYLVVRELIGERAARTLPSVSFQPGGFTAAWRLSGN